MAYLRREEHITLKSPWTYKGMDRWIIEAIANLGAENAHMAAIVAEVRRISRKAVPYSLIARGTKLLADAEEPKIDAVSRLFRAGTGRMIPANFYFLTTRGRSWLEFQRSKAVN